MTQQKASREEQIKQDVHELHRLGYAQELFRTMGGFSNFAISFSIISILTGAVILYDYGLAWAGTSASLIGWPLVTIFVLLIAASMAEIASAYPTAGGLYYWASRMKNKNWGWWTAWLNLIGQFAIVAGINFSAAFFINDTLVTPLLSNANVDYTNSSVLLSIGGTAVLTGQLVTMGVLMLIQLAMNIARHQPRGRAQPGQRVVAHRHRRGRGHPHLRHRQVGPVRTQSVPDPAARPIR